MKPVTYYLPSGLTVDAIAGEQLGINAVIKGKYIEIYLYGEIAPVFRFNQMSFVCFESNGAPSFYLSIAFELLHTFESHYNNILQLTKS